MTVTRSGDVSSEAQAPARARTDTGHLRHVKTLGAVGVISIATLVLKFVQDLALAYLIGVSSAVDAFGIAFAIINVGVRFIIGPVIICFIPAYISALEHEGRHAATDFLGELIPMLSAAAIVVTLLLEFAAPLLIGAIGADSGPAAHALGTALLRAFLLVVPLRAGTQLATAILNSEHEFSIPAATSAISPAVAILAMFVFTGDMGIYALIVGLVGGEAVQLLVLVVMVARHTGRMRFHWQGVSPHVRGILNQYVPVLAGTSIAVFNPLIDRAIASGLGPGSISHLLYGQKVISAGLTIATYAVSSVLLPAFSRLVAQENWRDVRKSMTFYTLLLAGLGLPPVLAAEFFSHDFVRLVLQHGAFHAADTDAVAQVVRLQSFQIPFAIAGIMVSRVVAALRATYILTIGAVINVVVNVWLDIVFKEYWGLGGIALSSAVVYMVSFAYLSAAASMLVQRQLRNA